MNMWRLSASFNLFGSVGWARQIPFPFPYYSPYICILLKCSRFAFLFYYARPVCWMYAKHRKASANISDKSAGTTIDDMAPGF